MLSDLVDIDVDGGVASTGVGHYLCIDKVPFAIWLAIFLGSFGISGLILNNISLSIFSVALPLWVSGTLSLFISILPTRILVNIFGRFMPKIESSAVSVESLKGSVGEITIGKATFDMPAEAKIVDGYNQIHYVLVRPEQGEVLNQGDGLVLFSRENDGIWNCSKFDRQPIFED